MNARSLIRPPGGPEQFAQPGDVRHEGDQMTTSPPPGILVVDDDAPVLAVLGTALPRCGGEKVSEERRQAIFLALLDAEDFHEFSPAQACRLVAHSFALSEVQVQQIGREGRERLWPPCAEPWEADVLCAATRGLLGNPVPEGPPGPLGRSGG